MKHLPKSIAFLLSIFLSYGILGCSFGRGFRAPPEWWTRFSENGASENEIRQALLECGSSIPGYFTEFRMPDGERFPEAGLNEAVSVTKCMKNSGFPYKSLSDLCAGGTDINGIQRKPDVPACQPDVVVPKRSIENRLNSPYCRIYPKAAICQPKYDPRLPQSNAPADLKPVMIAPATDKAS